ITNIVLMGSGEPLDNFDNVIKFLYLVNDVSGLNISMRNISLSTCGIAPKIDELAKLNLQINLTISLHSADQVKREEIMPIARAYSLETLMISVRNYFEATKRRVIFEYTLIDDANDSYSDALKLANLTRNISAHINLIRLNPVKETKMRGTSDIKAKKFLEYLTNLNVSATLRRQMGVDIEGACGQLRQRYIEEDKE
ncbi:MAG: radical SAM protein, partial [Clostridia bacterium]